jgi:molecular chaperone DnaJ
MTEHIAIWRVLEIKPTQDKAQIKRAYRKKARLLHPDVNDDEGAQEAFANLQTAYEQALLQATAPTQRKSLTLDDVFAPEPQPPAPRPRPQQTVPRFDQQLDSLFDTPKTSPRGDDLHQEVTVTFAQALEGASINVSTAPRRLCHTCSGSGTVASPCTICGGSGVAAGAGCWNCHGLGYLSPERCQTCGGSGSVAGSETVVVTVPAGSRQGSVLRVPGRGHADANLRGDLVARLVVKPHEQYVFGPGNSLLMDLPIDVATAGLGGTRTIELPDGTPYDLAIPAMAGDKREIIIPGKGWPGPDGAGDVRVKLHVGFPSKLTQQMRDALRAYREAADET